jgi:hypothetical protein
MPSRLPRDSSERRFPPKSAKVARKSVTIREAKPVGDFLIHHFNPLRFHAVLKSLTHHILQDASRFPPFSLHLERSCAAL